MSPVLSTKPKKGPHPRSTGGSSSGGSLLGPVILAFSLAGSGAYQEDFLLLLIPFVVLIILAIGAWRMLPDPVGFSTPSTKQGSSLLPRVGFIQ